MPGTGRNQGDNREAAGGFPFSLSETNRAIERLNDLRDFLLRQPPDSALRKQVESLMARQRLCLAMLLEFRGSRGSAS